MRRIVQAYRDEEGKIGDAQCSGRPALAAAVVDPFMNVREIRDTLTLSCSVETIRCRLGEAGLMNYIATKKQQLTRQKK